MALPYGRMKSGSPAFPLSPKKSLSGKAGNLNFENQNLNWKSGKYWKWKKRKGKETKKPENN